MSDQASPLSPQEAIAPLRRALAARFPEARFAIRQSPDRLRVYLDVATNAEDDFAVLETAAPLTVELFLRHGVQVHVFPFRDLPTADRLDAH